MSHLQPAPTVSSRGLRYETPDSSARNQGSALPSPPPRPRLRLKRRNVSSQLNPPTQHFLASVAAADVPIPSVEEPEFAMIDHEMMDNLSEVQARNFDDMGFYHHLHTRRFSPPKTPALDIQAALATTKFPDWTIDSDWSSSDMDSASDCESSRPSTAFSTQTSASLFSRYSMLSDDECLSPGPEVADPTKPTTQGEAGTTSRKPRRAPWTKAMTAHLWSTYMLYLQDPKVTPLRLGKSCIPPHGVCLRVAREAKRSWKGSSSKSTPLPSDSRSTPTVETSKRFVQWPHTSAATRAHLRELCRLNATAKAAGRRRFMSRSPTPFNKAAHRRWNRRATPARSPSIFSSNDMAMSLTLSTSETMQPHGPLAQLAQSPLEPFPELTPWANPGADTSVPEPSAPELARLGSPFAANSYGPSTSSSLAADLSVPQQSNSLGSRKSLKSPVRLTRSRSGTQKRKSLKAAEDQPKKRRPSLTTTFGEKAATTTQDSTGPLMGNLSDPFQPELAAGVSSAQQPRLGSPFPGSNFSQSFPNRSSTPLNFNLSALRRPFATIQQPNQRRSESPSARSSLASRLAYLDQRLRDFRNRRRSQSPL